MVAMVAAVTNRTGWQQQHGLGNRGVVAREEEIQWQWGFDKEVLVVRMGSWRWQSC